MVVPAVLTITMWRCGVRNSDCVNGRNPSDNGFRTNKMIAMKVMANGCPIELVEVIRTGNDGRSSDYVCGWDPIVIMATVLTEA